MGSHAASGSWKSSFDRMYCVTPSHRPHQLEDAGAFAWKCTADEQREGTICPEQTSALINVQFIAQITQISSPLLGQLVDVWGPTTMVYFMTVSECIGLGLLVLAVAAEIDRLLYAAFVLVALACWCGAMLTVQAGLYFPDGRARSRVIVSLNALFDAGSVTYLGLWGLGKVISLTAIVSGYWVVAVVVFGTASYFWTVAVPASEEEEDPEDEEELDPAESMDKETSSDQEEEKDVSGGPAASVSTQPGAYTMLSERATVAQLTSYPFFLVIVYWIVHVTANQWVLTTTRDFLATLGDDEVDNKYLTIFTILLPTSIVALPCVDYILSRYGFIVALQVINALALGYNLVRLLGDNLQVQILGFCFFTFFRCFLFGIVLSFIPVLLSPALAGKASGILFAITGVTAFLNIPLARSAVEKGDFFIPNLLYTLLLIPCVVAVVGLGRVMHRETEAKELAKSRRSEPQGPHDALEEIHE